MPARGTQCSFVDCQGLGLSRCDWNSCLPTLSNFVVSYSVQQPRVQLAPWLYVAFVCVEALPVLGRFGDRLLPLRVGSASLGPSPH